MVVGMSFYDINVFKRLGSKAFQNLDPSSWEQLEVHQENSDLCGLARELIPMYPYNTFGVEMAHVSTLSIYIIYIYIYMCTYIYIKYSIYPPKTSRCWKQACGLRAESHSQVRSSWSLSQQALLAQVIHMCSRSTSRTSADASPTLHDTSGIPSYTRFQMWPPHLSVGRESSEGRCG